MEAISVAALSGAPWPDVEVVERKGLGHPDTICDALAEELSVALSRFYLERFGAVLHHNVDKALLWGGVARAAFGGGEVLAPMEIYLAGRATREVRGVVVPVEELAVETSRRWLREHLHALDAEAHVRFHCLVRPGSQDLVDLFERHAKAGSWLCNDTSIGVGYAPDSPLERAALAVAAHLDDGARSSAPWLGEDVKVMAVRRGERTRLTVACAFVGKHLADRAAYVERRAALVPELAGIAVRSGLAGDVEVAVNAADDVESGKVYLTVTGTSAESGDDGEVGRGNRASGLITPMRPMTLEATCGKNPVSHVGKLYQVAARELAAAVVAQVPGVAAAECVLVSEIGRPVDQPQIASVRVRTKDGAALADVERSVADVARAELAKIPSIWRRVIAGEVRLY
jgi:S-adenosylmethionine synthetase